MKINKNIFAFAICLAMFSPVNASEENSEVTQVTEALSQSISTEDASMLLQNIANKLEDGNQFRIDNTIYSITQDTETRISQEGENILISIMTQVINAAISTVAGEIQSMQTNIISKEEAVSILEACANSLVDGSQFELNDTTYTIESPNKSTENKVEEAAEEVEDNDIVSDDEA